MRPVVGSLLTALGLMMAAGCALPGGSSRGTEGSGFQSRLSSENVDAGSERRLTFKKPRSASSSVADSASGQADKPASRRIQAASDESEGQNGVSAFTAGHSSDHSPQHRDTIPSPQLSFAEASDEDSDTALVSQVRHVELKDNNSNPIQLQGLDVDDGRTPESASKPLISPWDQTGDRAKKSESRPTTVDLQTITDGAPRKSAGVGTENRQSPSGLSRMPYPAPVEVLKQASRGGGLQQASATASSTATPSASWQADLDQLIARLEQDLARQPADGPSEPHFDAVRKQAHLRLLYLIAERQEDALTAIPLASTAQQEFWQQMIWALSNSLDAEQFPDSDERAAQTLTPLSSALRQMREEAPLSIKNMSFCRKISYFGNYDRFPRNEFTPGYEVLLYTEIENFTSTPTVDGEYRTSLKSLMEIADATGKVVWTKGFPSTEDFCRNPRRDYFHNYQFHIPEDLPIGSYSLKLTIVDELSHKRVSSSLGFVLK
ncbi:hypothetical protein [Schlesneria paludicola]|uniref:hypothetical protein n=1 Tax=Schlesneria paludicola TaxID=360056 RepID=UPI00029A3558|nr:hypothetical protein [Schlesneria paludicola]